MPVSALKKLKASIHDRKSGKTPKPHSKKPVQAKKETPAQRANRLRQDTLLPEWQRRSKVGGIVDRRIGEDDPTMTPEDRMLKRYVAENQRSKRANAFNLEDDSDPDPDDFAELTHGGRPLSDLPQRGPFKGIAGSDSGDGDDDQLFSRSKRPLEEAIEDSTRRQEQAEEDEGPARKKSKKEVMEEVIAKSKLHKHERQQAHEEDLDMRDELDKGLPDLLTLLRGGKSAKNAPNARAKASDDAQQYDQRVRQMAQDKRAQPSERTKTDEEKADEHAKHLQHLEDQRLRRMRGEILPQASDSDPEDEQQAPENEDDDDDGADDAATFGFTSSKALQEDQLSPQPELDDEDDFLIEKDLVADSSDLGSDADLDNEEEASDEELPNGTAAVGQATGDDDDDDDDDFLKDVLNEKPVHYTSKVPQDPATSLAYTYPCPQSHNELLQVFKNVSHADIPTVIQRIRALYHTSLAAQNKTKLVAFATALVDHVAYLPVHDPSVPLPTLEAIIRHIHSMSRAFPIEIANAYRTHVSRIEDLHTSPQQPSLPTAGDLAILTAIGTTYPTSDHFHQVVTPAITTTAHWLETLMLRAHADTLPPLASRTGAFLVGLALKYQRLARRLVPEALRFTAEALPRTPDPQLAAHHVANASALAALYAASPAAIEALAPLLAALKRATSATPAAAHAYTSLKTQLHTARRARRPLQEHHHRPLPLKTALPAFEDSFNPTKHYDGDRERSDAAKLRKEHKRESKAAARELRRDAEFVGREKLRARKEADAAYNDKFRRIIGGIEREEGQGKNEYERGKERERRRRG